MPSLKIVVLAIVFVCIGFFGMSYYLDTLPWISQAIIDTTQPLITFGKLIYAKWVALPSIVKQIVLMGIPTLFAIFFMWTKDRAMQKLQETELQAKAQTTQLSGEANAAYKEIESLRQQNKQLTVQLQSNPLSQNLEEAQQLVTTQQTTITDQVQQIESLQREVATLIGQINGMKTQINYVNRVK